MIKTDPRSIARFRETTAKAVVLDHRRKRCRCNKVVTARQLQIYGQCEACRKAALSTS
jgi:hypothetical protein